ncbi:histidinol phosphatase and related phosphatase [Candidatus Vecturithrix granuli]|uniref:D,D-heptose 1,7-bisphosphate phosphatase n=1 Tax=Vecturithrix granuli TaxID=1499967 RepID=A0A081C788_VECG1|nr:histidinol phosphatase and related phosphatase [Candidatus Vecturithrix granuli]
MPKRQFVLLDRDGTIIVERHYLSDPDLVELLPGAAEGLRRLQNMRFGLVVVTNQSGLSRGYFTETQLARIHQRMNALLKAEHVILDGIYICPHRPEDRCSCRKPEPGLVFAAAAEMDFEPSECLVIGDKPSDIGLGQRIGATTLLVRTGYGNQTVNGTTCQPNYIADDLNEASQIIRGLLK